MHLYFVMAAVLVQLSPFEIFFGRKKPFENISVLRHQFLIYETTT